MKIINVRYNFLEINKYLNNDGISKRLHLSSTFEFLEVRKLFLRSDQLDGRSRENFQYKIIHIHLKIIIIKMNNNNKQKKKKIR